MTDILSTRQLALLLAGAPWRRLVVVGDSIAVGVREPCAGYRDLSWIDRIAEPLNLVAPGLELLNLGERNLLAGEVRERQLDAALDFDPDLAFVVAGANDALRPGFSPAAVRHELDAMVGPLRAADADVVMVALMDIVAAGLVPAFVDEPLRLLADVTREVAAINDAILVDMRDHPASADPGIYSSDRLHGNARGHAIVGTESVRVLAAAIATRAAR